MNCAPWICDLGDTSGSRRDRRADRAAARRCPAAMNAARTRRPRRGRRAVGGRPRPPSTAIGCPARERRTRSGGCRSPTDRATERMLVAAAEARRPSVSSATSAARITARCRRSRRVRSSVAATAPHVGLRGRGSARIAAASRGDQFFGVRAEQDRDAPVGQYGGERHHAASGYRTTITWVLVPLIPNADTAAMPLPVDGGPRGQFGGQPQTLVFPVDFAAGAHRCAGWRARRRVRRR